MSIYYMHGEKNLLVYIYTHIYMYVCMYVFM